MRAIIYYINILIVIGVLISPVSVLAEEGVVGATCSADPQVFATVEGKWQRIYCFRVDDTFFPGITMLAAKKVTIAQCKKNNALDPSGNYRDASDTCYDRCEKDSHCLFGDNR